MKKIPNQTGKRFLSLLLALLIVFSESGRFWPADASAAEAASGWTSFVRSPDSLRIPSEFADLQEIYKASEAASVQPPPLLIHIQDAHANVSGQESIAGLLDTLFSRYGTVPVLVEGGTKDDTLTALKSQAPAAGWKRAARKFLLEGKIAGEEYLNLTSDHPMRILGIEDEALYREGLEAYAALTESREEALGRVKRLRAAAEIIKRTVYPKPLRVLDEACRENANVAECARLAASGSDTGPYPNLRRFRAADLKEKTVDFDAARLEQTAVFEKIGRDLSDSEKKALLAKAAGSDLTSRAAGFRLFVSAAARANVSIEKFPALSAYREYLASLEEIQFDDFLEEIHQVVNARFDTAGEAVRTLHAVDRRLALLEKAQEIRLSSDEFAELSHSENAWSERAIEAYLNRMLAERGSFRDLMPVSDRLTSAAPLIEAFYGSAARRDETFVRNAEKWMRHEKSPVAVLIAGGYHTEGLKKKFREKGWSYAVLTPRITSETIQKKYERILLEPIRPGSDRRSAAADLDASRSGIAAAKLAESVAGGRMAELIRVAQSSESAPKTAGARTAAEHVSSSAARPLSWRTPLVIAWNIWKQTAEDERLARELGIQPTIRARGLYYFMIELLGISPSESAQKGLDRMFALWTQYMMVGDDLLDRFGHRLSEAELEQILDETDRTGRIDLRLRGKVSALELEAAPISAMPRSSSGRALELIDSFPDRLERLLAAASMKDREKLAVREAFRENARLFLHSYLLERKAGILPPTRILNAIFAEKDDFRPMMGLAALSGQALQKEEIAARRALLFDTAILCQYLDDWMDYFSDRSAQPNLLWSIAAERHPEEYRRLAAWVDSRTSISTFLGNWAIFWHAPQTAVEYLSMTYAAYRQAARTSSEIPFFISAFFLTRYGIRVLVGHRVARETAAADPDAGPAPAARPGGARMAGQRWVGAGIGAFLAVMSGAFTLHFFSLVSSNSLKKPGVAAFVLVGGSTLMILSVMMGVDALSSAFQTDWEYRFIWPVFSLISGRWLMYASLPRLMQVRAGETVLELGSGYPASALSARLFPHGTRYLISDIHQESARANRMFAGSRARTLVASAAQIPARDGSIDVVFGVNPIYLDDPATAVEVRRVLKPGGRFYAVWDVYGYYPPLRASGFEFVRARRVWYPILNVFPWPLGEIREYRKIDVPDAGRRPDAGIEIAGARLAVKQAAKAAGIIVSAPLMGVGALAMLYGGLRLAKSLIVSYQNTNLRVNSVLSAHFGKLSEDLAAGRHTGALNQKIQTREYWRDVMREAGQPKLGDKAFRHVRSEIIVRNYRNPGWQLDAAGAAELASLWSGSRLAAPAPVRKDRLHPGYFADLENSPLAQKASFSGVRAEVGEGAGIPEDFKVISAAYAYSDARALFQRWKRVYPGKKSFVLVIGHDPRPTGEAILEWQIAGWKLAAAQTPGVTIRIIDIGVTTTPLIESAVRSNEADGGVMITASHNPLAQNGFKYLTGASEPEAGSVNDSGALLNPQKMYRVIRMAEGIFTAVSKNRLGFVDRLNRLTADIDPRLDAVRRQRFSAAAERAYIRETQKKVFGLSPAAVERLKKRHKHHTAVIDSNGGAGATGIPQRMLEAFGFRAYEINGKLGFPAHGIEPIGEALVQIGAQIVFHDADAGVAGDYDLDRGQLVGHDRKGQVKLFDPQETSYLSVAAMLAWVRTHPELYPEARGRKVAVVVHDATSERLRLMLNRLGVQIEETETGEVNVVTRMRELERSGYFVVAGVEGYNGGVILRGSQVRDGTQTLLLSLLVLADRKVFNTLRGMVGLPAWKERTYSLLDVLASLPPYYTIQKDDIPYPFDASEEEALKKRVRDAFMQRLHPMPGGGYSIAGLGDETFRFENNDPAAYSRRSRVIPSMRRGALPGDGGLILRFWDSQDRPHKIWFRRSKTQLGPFRSMVDGPTVERARALEKIRDEIYAKAAGARMSAYSKEAVLGPLYVGRVPSQLLAIALMGSGQARLMAGDGAVFTFRYRELPERGGYTIEAVHGNKVAGYIDVEPSSIFSDSTDDISMSLVRRPEFPRTDEALIVGPEFRTAYRGIGHTLLSVALQISWLRGKQRFQAISAYNPDAQHFYEQYGFKPITPEHEDYVLTYVDMKYSPNLEHALTVRIEPKKGLTVAGARVAGQDAESRFDESSEARLFRFFGPSVPRLFAWIGADRNESITGYSRELEQITNLGLYRRLVEKHVLSFSSRSFEWYTKRYESSLIPSSFFLRRIRSEAALTRMAFRLDLGPRAIVAKIKGAPMLILIPQKGSPIAPPYDEKQSALIGEALGRLHRAGIRHGDVVERFNPLAPRFDHFYFDGDRVRFIDFGEGARRPFKLRLSSAAAYALFWLGRVREKGLLGRALAHMSPGPRMGAVRRAFSTAYENALEPAGFGARLAYEPNQISYYRSLARQKTRMLAYRLSRDGNLGLVYETGEKPYRHLGVYGERLVIHLHAGEALVPLQAVIERGGQIGAVWIEGSTSLPVLGALMGPSFPAGELDADPSLLERLRALTAEAVASGRKADPVFDAIVGDWLDNGRLPRTMAPRHPEMTIVENGRQTAIAPIDYSVYGSGARLASGVEEKMYQWWESLPRDQRLRAWKISEIAEALGIDATTVVQYRGKVNRRLEDESKLRIASHADADIMIDNWWMAVPLKFQKKLWRQSVIADRVGLDKSTVHHRVHALNEARRLKGLREIPVTTVILIYNFWKFDVDPSLRDEEWSILRFMNALGLNKEAVMDNLGEVHERLMADSLPGIKRPFLRAPGPRPVKVPTTAVWGSKTIEESYPLISPEPRRGENRFASVHFRFTHRGTPVSLWAPWYYSDKLSVDRSEAGGGIIRLRARGSETALEFRHNGSHMTLSLVRNGSWSKIADLPSGEKFSFSLEATSEGRLVLDDALGLTDREPREDQIAALLKRMAYADPALINDTHMKSPSISVGPLVLDLPPSVVNGTVRMQLIADRRHGPRYAMLVDLFNPERYIVFEASGRELKVMGIDDETFSAEKVNRMGFSILTHSRNMRRFYRAITRKLVFIPAGGDGRQADIDFGRATIQLSPVMDGARPGEMGWVKVPYITSPSLTAAQLSGRARPDAAVSEGMEETAFPAYLVRPSEFNQTVPRMGTIQKIPGRFLAFPASLWQGTEPDAWIGYQDGKHYRYYRYVGRRSSEGVAYAVYRRMDAHRDALTTVRFFNAKTGGHEMTLTGLRDRHGNSVRFRRIKRLNLSFLLRTAMDSGSSALRIHTNLARLATAPGQSSGPRVSLPASFFWTGPSGHERLVAADSRAMTPDAGDFISALKSAERVPDLAERLVQAYRRNRDARPYRPISNLTVAAEAGFDAAAIWRHMDGKGWFVRLFGPDAYRGISLSALLNAAQRLMSQGESADSITAERLALEGGVVKATAEKYLNDPQSELNLLLAGARLAQTRQGESSATGRYRVPRFEVPVPRGVPTERSPDSPMTIHRVVGHSDHSVRLKQKNLFHLKEYDGYTVKVDLRQTAAGGFYPVHAELMRDPQGNLLSGHDALIDGSSTEYDEAGVVVAWHAHLHDAELSALKPGHTLWIIKRLDGSGGLNFAGRRHLFTLKRHVNETVLARVRIRTEGAPAILSVRRLKDAENRTVPAESAEVEARFIESGARLAAGYSDPAEELQDPHVRALFMGILIHWASEHSGEKLALAAQQGILVADFEPTAGGYRVNFYGEEESGERRLIGSREFSRKSIEAFKKDAKLAVQSGREPEMGLGESEAVLYFNEENRQVRVFRSELEKITDRLDGMVTIDVSRLDLKGAKGSQEFVENIHALIRELRMVRSDPRYRDVVFSFSGNTDHIRMALDLGLQEFLSTDAQALSARRTVQWVDREPDYRGQGYVSVDYARSGFIQPIRPLLYYSFYLLALHNVQGDPHPVTPAHVSPRVIQEVRRLAGNPIGVELRPEHVFGFAQGILSEELMEISVAHKIGPIVHLIGARLAEYRRLVQAVGASA